MLGPFFETTLVIFKLPNQTPLLNLPIIRRGFITYPNWIDFRYGLNSTRGRITMKTKTLLPGHFYKARPTGMARSRLGSTYVSKCISLVSVLDYYRFSSFETR